MISVKTICPKDATIYLRWRSKGFWQLNDAIQDCLTKLSVDQQIFKRVTWQPYLILNFLNFYVSAFLFYKIKLCTTGLSNNFFQIQNLHIIGFILILNLLFFEQLVQKVTFDWASLQILK